MLVVFALFDDDRLEELDVNVYRLTIFSTGQLEMSTSQINNKVFRVCDIY